MAKVSKYQQMVGQEVREGVRISNYRRLVRISTKSGKSYYRYEVELNEVLWVSTTSFNKGSYGKRLAKAMNSVKTQNKAPQSVSKPQEVDEQGLTPKERRSLIKRFGYAGVFTSEGFIRADVYEAQMEAERQERKRQERIAFEMEDAYRGVKEAQELLVYDVETIANICLDWNISSVEKYLEVKYDVELEMETAIKTKTTYLVAYLEELRYQLANDYMKWLSSVWVEVLVRIGKVVKVVEPQQEANDYFDMFIGKNEREVKKVYRKLSKELHPDMKTGDEAEFIKMQQMYEVGLVLARTNTTYHTWKLWKSNFSHVCTYEEFVA
jgi:hypothetical protein